VQERKKERKMVRFSTTSLFAVVVTSYLAASCTVHGFIPQQRQSAARLSTVSSSKLHQSAATADETKTTTPDAAPANDKSSASKPFFSNIMAANRAEIAVRIMRAATEMNAGTVGIYVEEDRYSQHRWGADRSFLLEKAEGATPISAYLDIPQIIKVAKEANVDAIHPGMFRIVVCAVNKSFVCR
jgi:pyruvate carboxylase